MNDREAIEDRFPKLADDGYRQTSPATDVYNCVAWTVRRTNSWLSPEPVDGYEWPRDVLGDGTSLGDYQRFFELAGFSMCCCDCLEVGLEKLALYGEQHEFDHVAFQRRDGTWSSKLGELGDIQHDRLASLERPGGLGFAPVVLYMGRPRQPHQLAETGLLLPGDEGPSGRLILP